MLPAKVCKKVVTAEAAGGGYANILKLSGHAMNVKKLLGVEGDQWGGNSWLAGFHGDGRVAAFGDSNGFAAAILKLMVQRTLSV